MKTKSRQTIGLDPLDAVVPSTGSAESGGAAIAMRKPRSLRVIRATFHIPPELLDEARDAVDFLSGPPHRLTMAAFASSAIQSELHRLRSEHTKGKPFPSRPGDLRKGRRVNAA